MKQDKLFILFLIMLVLISSAQAITIDFQEPNNERRGDHVEFDVEIILNSLEQFMLENDYLKIKKIDLILEGPEDFQETCSIYDEQDIDCDLELEVDIEGTEYEIEWDTSSKQEKGTYTSKVKAHVSDKYPQFSYCGIMEGIFREWYFTQTQGTFDPVLDLDGNGIVDIFDVLIFSSEEQYQEDSVLFGKFREHFGAIQDIQIIIDILNVYEDEVVDISDLVVFTQNMDDEAWCLIQLNIEEYVAYEYESEEKEFKLTSKQRSSPEEEEFPSWYYQGIAQEELVQDTTQKQIMETPGDAGIKILLIIGVFLELIIIFYFLKKLS